MWMNKTEGTSGDVQWYTIHYCPWCKLQRYWSTQNGLFICGACKNRIKYDKHLRRMRLI